MYTIISSLVLALFLALPAQALTLIAENGDVAVIGPGDVFDNVVMFDTSSITMTGGSVSDTFLMIDAATATFTGGSLGTLIVLGNAVATMVIQPGTLDVDGNPTPEPTTLDFGVCPSCTVSAILANGDPIGPAPVSALQSGKVEVTAVPEPTTAAMFGLGLFGLGLLPFVRNRA